MTITREVKGDVMHCVSKYTYIYVTYYNFQID